MKHRVIGAAFMIAALLAGGPGVSQTSVTYTVLGFDDLTDWDKDDHSAALDVFRTTCVDIEDPDWNAICAAAHHETSGKAFFEMFFRPVLIQDGQQMLFTGYFEPELNGALSRTGPYQYPIYALPEEAKSGQWLTRREIETTDALQGRGLEIAWVDDLVDLFFLQVQGSGRIRLPDGSTVRVGYAGKNGHPYRSVGMELVRRGEFELHEVSAQAIRSWVRQNPEDGQELLYHNPSYVFFRTVNEVPSDLGPLGAMNRSVTEKRTIAVDPAFVPLGAPVWIEKEGFAPMRRLMVAQDTGSAIKGAQRADIFMGTGARAGREAGRIRDGGRMLVLMPIQRAFALLSDPWQ